MSLIQNPFANQQATIGHPAHEEHEPLGSLDKEFQDEIKHPEEVDEIIASLLLPKGWYVSDPERYRPTVFTEVSVDEDGTRTGVVGPRNMGVVLARLTLTVGEETYSKFTRIRLSPDSRKKAVWVEGVFDHIHPTKPDTATKLYAGAQQMYRARHKRLAGRVSELIEFLAETPFQVNCMPKDNGDLTPWEIAPVGRR